MDKFDIYLHAMHISKFWKSSLSCHWFAEDNNFLKQENSSLFAFCFRFSINNHKLILYHMKEKISPVRREHHKIRVQILQ